MEQLIENLKKHGWIYQQGKMGVSVLSKNRWRFILKKRIGFLYI